MLARHHHQLTIPTVTTPPKCGSQRCGSQERGRATVVLNRPFSSAWRPFAALALLGVTSFFVTTAAYKGAPTWTQEVAALLEVVVLVLSSVLVAVRGGGRPSCTWMGAAGAVVVTAAAVNFRHLGTSKTVSNGLSAASSSILMLLVRAPDAK